MKKITKNIKVKVASNKKKISGNILNAPKTHKLPRVVKGKIGGIRKTPNKSIAKPGQTITGKIRRRTNWPKNLKRNRKYL